MTTIQRVSGTLALAFCCAHCGYAAPVQVEARGTGSSNFGNAHTQRAYENMLHNARMRAELAPCPRCGARAFGLLRATFVKTLLFLWVIPVGTFAWMWLSERRFEDEAGVAGIMCGGLAAIMFVCLAIWAGLEVRRAPGAVHFSPDDLVEAKRMAAP